MKVRPHGFILPLRRASILRVCPWRPETNQQIFCTNILNYDQIHSCSLRNLVSFELSNRSGLLHILPPHIRIPRNCTSGISHENVSGHKSMQIYAGTEDSPESPPPGRSLDTLDSSS
jgi:hypothetical protein